MPKKIELAGGLNPPQNQRMDVHDPFLASTERLSAKYPSVVPSMPDPNFDGSKWLNFVQVPPCAAPKKSAPNI